MPVASKRPAANLDDTTQVKKKPAAMPSVNETLRKLKSATASPEDQENDNEDGAMVLVKRDKGKGEKFARMRAAGQIPQHILHLYDETAKSSPSPRDFRTNIINQLFNKSDSGVFTMNTGAKLFTEAYKVYQQKYARDEQEAMSRSVMLWPLFFQNNILARRVFHAPSVKPSESERERKEAEKRKTRLKTNSKKDRMREKERERERGGEKEKQKETKKESLTERERG